LLREYKRNVSKWIKALAKRLVCNEKAVLDGKPVNAF